MKKNIAIFILLICLISCSHFKEQLQQQFQQPSLINSASRGNISEIKAFIQSGANINEQDKDGYRRTPLMHAIANSKMEAAEYLINAGADVKIKDSSGYDALIMAVDMGNDGLEVIDMLLDKGADINSRDLNGWTPIMHTLAFYNSSTIARLLIKRGADLNVKDPATSKSLDALALDYRQPGLAAEFKEAMSRDVNDVYDAKIVFIMESQFLMSESYYFNILVGERIVNMKPNSINYIDIHSGHHNIIIKEPSFEGDYKITLDAVVGQTYYFLVTQRKGKAVGRVLEIVGEGVGSAVGIGTAGGIAGEAVGGLIGGLIGVGAGATVESQVDAKDAFSAGLFTITSLEESVAKEKIKALSKTKK